MKELYYLSPAYDSSTAAINHILAYVKGLAENGVHVHLFFIRPSKNREKFEGVIDNVDFHYLWDSDKTKNKYWNYLVNLRRFYSLMEPRIPVLVYGCSFVLYFLRKKRDIKLYHERTENPYVVKEIFNYLYLKTLPKLDGIVVITPSLRNLFIEEFCVNPEKIIVANMVVDESRFSNIRQNDDARTISYCGTVSEWKDGVSYLVKAFAIVNKKYPDYKLVIMGGFENTETKNLILSIVNDNNLGDRVVFTGIVKNNEMPQRLMNSEILALSRPIQRGKAVGFATKIGEYLMTGKPVVMTNVGDATFYLADKENVVFAKPNDEMDFADKLLWVIEHPQEASEIGKKGKEAAHKEFNYFTESKKIISLIFG